MFFVGGVSEASNSSKSCLRRCLDDLDQCKLETGISECSNTWEAIGRSFLSESCGRGCHSAFFDAQQDC